jgi:hypothetical protein
VAEGDRLPLAGEGSHRRRGPPGRASSRRCPVWRVCGSRSESEPQCVRSYAEQGPDARLFFRQHLLLLDDDLRAAIAEATGLSQAISTVALSRLTDAMRGAVGFVDRLHGLAARVEERLELLPVAIGQQIRRSFGGIDEEPTVEVD